MSPPPLRPPVLRAGASTTIGGCEFPWDPVDSGRWTVDQRISRVERTRWVGEIGETPAMPAATTAPNGPPGVEKPRRFRPRFHYELLACGIAGHELIATDVAEIREEDAVVVREGAGVRWHRCLRCDSWLPLSPPVDPVRQTLPPPRDIRVPLRGRALRDKIVLRVIAVDRAFHFVVLAFLGVLIFFVAAHEHELQHRFYRVLEDVQGGIGGGPVHPGKTGLVHDIDDLLDQKSTTLRGVGVIFFLYAALEGLEAVGLWLGRRWAEYLTFVATALLLPFELYELTESVSPLKVTALLINLAIVVYLVLAKRLFGLRGGAVAERAGRERDAGWPALRRTAPGR